MIGRSTSDYRLFNDAVHYHARHDDHVWRHQLAHYDSCRGVATFGFDSGFSYLVRLVAQLGVSILPLRASQVVFVCVVEQTRHILVATGSGKSICVNVADLPRCLVVLRLADVRSRTPATNNWLYKRLMPPRRAW